IQELAAPGITTCALHRSGRAATGAADGQVIVWDLNRGVPDRVLSGHRRAVTSCVILEDGQRILTSADDHLLLLWQGGTGKSIQTFQKHSAHVKCCATKGNCVISGDADGQLWIWDLDMGRLRHRVAAHRSGLSACLLDGQVIAYVGSQDGTISLWNIETGTQMGQYTGHTGAITALSLGRYDDSEILVSASEDRTIRSGNRETLRSRPG